MANNVMGLCRDREVAADCINRLLVAGIRGDDIGVVTRDREESKELAAQAGVRAGLVGGDGGAGLLEEIKERIEGWTHSGDAEGSWGRDLAEKLMARGLDEQEARLCVDEVNNGAVLLTVRAEEGDLDAVRDCLSDCGARLLGRQGEGRTREQRMPLVEEQLGVSRRPVQRGEVVVRKGVVNEERRMNVQARHEEVYIERRPANRETEQGVGEVETIHVPLREEQIELVRQPRVVEEIVVRKRVVTEEREVRETVRREVPRLETTGDIERFVHGQEQEKLEERKTGGEG